MSAKSLTMLNVASGRPSSFAFALISSSTSPSRANQPATIFAIASGSSSYAPTPFSKTYDTFPASWHGMKPLSIIGRPQISASAIVPGPAFVIMQSHADMYSDMLFTNPRTHTLVFHFLAVSFCASFAFLPQIKTIWSLGASARSRASAICSSFPIPSPPPTNITVLACVSMDSSARIAGFARAWHVMNAGRMGKPWQASCFAFKPQRMACAATSCVATKHRSTFLWNQVRWHRVRSVTTVANGTLAAAKDGIDFMRAKTFKGTCCISGCTETIKSGLYSLNACANLRPTIAVYPVNMAS
mmetsp:Transcript_946/g.3615  ORF Transcript_946/g.3615 Transcript_946/m.3615 type:complete len:300 (-) Transcript_946:624-1523(-)